MTPYEGTYFARVSLIVKRCRGSDGDLDAITLSQGQALRLGENINAELPQGLRMLH